MQLTTDRPGRASRWPTTQLARPGSRRPPQRYIAHLRHSPTVVRLTDKSRRRARQRGFAVTKVSPQRGGFVAAFRRFGPKSVRLADLPCATGWSSSWSCSPRYSRRRTEIDIVVRSERDLRGGRRDRTAGAPPPTLTPLAKGFVSQCPSCLVRST